MLNISRYIKQQNRRTIESKDDPFIGVFVDYLAETTRGSIKKFLRQAADPLDSLIQNLAYYPALTATLVVDELLNGVVNMAILKIIQ